MRFAAAAFALGLGLSLGTIAGSAEGFERQWHLGASAGISDGSGLDLSPALGVYAAYGLSDVFDARIELTARGYELMSETDPHAVSAMVGLTYKLDVLRWVPWAGVYAGYLGFLEPPVALAFEQHDAALGLGMGLDYGFSRQLGLGATVRVDRALRHSGSSSFEALLRAEYRWGW